MVFLLFFDGTSQLHNRQKPCNDALILNFHNLLYLYRGIHWNICFAILYSFKTVKKWSEKLCILWGFEVLRRSLFQSSVALAADSFWQFWVPIESPKFLIDFGRTINIILNKFSCRQNRIFLFYHIFLNSSLISGFVFPYT